MLLLLPFPVAGVKCILGHGLSQAVTSFTDLMKWACWDCFSKMYLELVRFVNLGIAAALGRQRDDAPHELSP